MERDKKECILKAAVRAFERFGFKKASVDEIARDAGVAKGTVYLAAESKEDLFYQVLHREVRTWVAELSTLIDPRKQADQLLVDVALASLKRAQARPLVRDLLLGVVRNQLPGWAERLEELRGLGRTNVEEILRLGIRQGLFREGLEVPEVATVLQDLQVVGVLRTAEPGLDPARLRKLSTVALDLVLNGLREGGRVRVQPASSDAARTARL